MGSRAGRGLIGAALRAVAVLLGVAAVLVAAPPGARANVSFQARGQWVCDNNGTVSPIAGARVELWQNNSWWFDDKLGATHTGSDGAFSFGVQADDNFDLYAKLVLDDDHGVNLGEWYSFSPWDTQTDTTSSHAGTVNLGTWQISTSSDGHTPKCAIWQGAHNAYADYERVTGSPPPEGDYSINADFPCCGTPFTTLDNTRWPSGYPTGEGSGDPEGGYATNFHEFAHSVRHSFDGGFLHFLGDVATYNYAQNHTLCMVTNPGFAFNEGWAEFWARTPATCADPANYNQEGNVATALTGLEKCAGRATMVQVLKDNPGTIHSYAEFSQKFFARVGRLRCLITSITGNLNVESPLSSTQLTARVQAQIAAQTSFIAGLSRQLHRARRLAGTPDRCVPRGCDQVVQTLAQPSALTTQIAQAQLVLDRLKAGLAAAREAGFAPDFTQASLYDGLTAQRHAFERSNQAIAIAGLRRGIAAVTSVPDMRAARSTDRFRGLRGRLSKLIHARSLRRTAPAKLDSLVSPPAAPVDTARKTKPAGPVGIGPPVKRIVVTSG
jgi:hypothetical protein